MQSGNKTSNNKQQHDSSFKKVDADKPADVNVVAAHNQAEADMEQDPDLNNEPDPAADLDEGELARLDNDNH